MEDIRAAIREGKWIKEFRLSLIFYVCVCTKWFISVSCIWWAYLQQLTAQNGIHPVLFLFSLSLALEINPLASIMNGYQCRKFPESYRKTNHWIYHTYMAYKRSSMQCLVKCLHPQPVLTVFWFVLCTKDICSFAGLQLWRSSDFKVHANANE